MYQDVLNNTYRNTLNEHNDCTVIALTLTTGKPYIWCHTAMKEAGRKVRGRAVMERGIDVVKNRGINIRYLGCPKRNGRPISVKTIGEPHPKGRYIVRVRGHVLALVDGEVLDWTKDRRHIVQDMWEVLS